MDVSIDLFVYLCNCKWCKYSWVVQNQIIYVFNGRVNIISMFFLENYFEMIARQWNMSSSSDSDEVEKSKLNDVVLEADYFLSG